MIRAIVFFPVLLLFSFVGFSQKNKSPTAAASASFYNVKPEDADAIYFTAENFSIKADGKNDITAALQEAINRVKTEHNFGIVFIPSGSYLISRTIYVPTAVRLIGYGPRRPKIILEKNAPDFQSPDSLDKGHAKYMFWFTSSIVKDGEHPHDAGASIFYSAMSNIDLEIQDGNPSAVALRTHFAQHSFISHVDIHTNNGKAGMFDVGNEMEDVRFFGGQYGIYTTKPSPGWQFMMTDTYFEGQRTAAIKTQEGGLTIVRMEAVRCPKVIDIDSGFHERLFMEDCSFDAISNAAVTVSDENNATNQISLRNINCRNVPLLIAYRQSGKRTDGVGKIYVVKNFMHGLQMDSLRAAPQIKTIRQIEALKIFPGAAKKDIPNFPLMQSWVNLKSLGAKGDGVSDDTKAIQEAIDKYPSIFVPQGWYRLSETIHLRTATMMVGLSPIATQFILAENTPAFGGFGGPVALIETAKGGNAIFSGIGISTGADNPRAVAMKWMAGEFSYLNDVKFVGGHGGLERLPKIVKAEAPTKNFRDNWNGTDPAWDTQYWSLWITNGGGGTFKNIWTASTFAAAGTYVSNTSTPGHIYAMSVEHHVRNEVRFNNVSNFKVYALQLEEESREGTECQPLELEQCHNMVFANLYMFRVIRINKPYPYSIRNWSSSGIEFLNVHNYSQIKYTTSNPFYDVGANYTVRPWEFNRLFLDSVLQPSAASPGAIRLGTGFEFAEGLCQDSKGNLYFCESRMKRIYKWSAADRILTLVADYPWEPLSLACDKNDALLVVFRYTPKIGHMVDGKQEAFINPPDAAGTSFSGWGNSGFASLVYSIDPNNPDETIRALNKVPMTSVQNVYQALYPEHRWRDYHDFSAVTINRPTECFIAADSVTIIPVVYDLARSTGLAIAKPGKACYVTNEYEKRTVQLKVDKQGYLSDMKTFAEKGEFGISENAQGDVYIADGDIFQFDNSGTDKGMIKTPERPTAIVAQSQGIYFTSASSLWYMPFK